jgi:hypothetical protein
MSDSRFCNPWHNKSSTTTHRTVHPGRRVCWTAVHRISHIGHSPAGHGRRGAAAQDRRCVPGLHALRPDRGGEHRARRHRRALGSGSDRRGSAAGRRARDDLRAAEGIRHARRVRRRSRRRRGSSCAAASTTPRFPSKSGPPAGSSCSTGSRSAGSANSLPATSSAPTPATSCSSASTAPRCLPPSPRCSPTSRCVGLSVRVADRAGQAGVAVQPSSTIASRLTWKSSAMGTSSPCG